MQTSEIQRPIGFSPKEISSLINEEVVSQHAEDAAFLWRLRNAAVCAPHYKLKDLDRLDERVEANIDGLRVAGETGWNLSKQLLDQDEPGSVFSCGVVALESQEAEKIYSVYEKVEADPDLSNELIAAFGWVEPKSLQGKVLGLLDSSSSFWRRIGISACMTHRVNPKDHLLAAMYDDDDLLRARAYRAIGELGLKELNLKLREGYQSTNEFCRFWSSWSSLLIGQHGNAIQVLQEIADIDSLLNNNALNIVVRVMDTKASYEWLKGFAKKAERVRDAIQATAAVGDPIYIPWLIKQMENPKLAKVAGEAFSSITGADIAYEDLDGDQPEAADLGPNDEPEDENIQMDADENLPYPDMNLISQWWEERKQQFMVGNRYILGKPINSDSLLYVLNNGTQRQRYAAAIEFAIHNSGKPLFETWAPAKRQQQELQKWTS
jgi:uncharacterized protein (TIGR02270 family)